MRRLLAIGLLVVAAVWGFAQQRVCTPQGCFIVPSMPAKAEMVLPRDLKWGAGADGEHVLSEHGKVIGVYVVKTGQFFELLGNQWSKWPTPTPIPPPKQTEKILTGVMLDKLSSEAEVCEVNGVPVTCETAIKSLTDSSANGLQDDSQCVRVTIVAKEGKDRAALRKEIETGETFAPWRDHIRLWDAPPDHWSLECGFPTAADGVIMQTSDGVVGWRQEDLSHEKVREGLRKILPQYDPKKDPGILRWLSPELAFITEHKGALVLGGLGVLLLLLKRNPPPQGT